MVFYEFSCRCRGRLVMDIAGGCFDGDGRAVDYRDIHIASLIGTTQRSKLECCQCACRAGASRQSLACSRKARSTAWRIRWIQARRGGASPCCWIGGKNGHGDTSCIQVHTHGASLCDRGLLGVSKQSQGFVMKPSGLEIIRSEHGRGKHRQHTQNNNHHDQFNDRKAAFAHLAHVMCQVLVGGKARGVHACLVELLLF